MLKFQHLDLESGQVDHSRSGSARQPTAHLTRIKNQSRTRSDVELMGVAVDDQAVGALAESFKSYGFVLE